MFALDGERTHVSRVIETLIKQFLKPYGDRITCVVYRKDPLDNYLFTTALLGVRQQEPMFGPIVWDDRRNVQQTAPENPLGFSSREGTVPGCRIKFEHENWQAYFSCRSTEEEFQRCIASLREELEPCLDDLLRNPARSPLYPDLWYQERLARDRMRDEFRNLTPSMDLRLVAAALTRSIQSMAADLLHGNQTDVGLYFNTDKDWILLGSEPVPIRKPLQVGGGRKTINHERNAFNWVDHSTRPVLLRHSMSDVWRRRLEGCSTELAVASQQDDFGGICIVPLLDLNQPSRSMGVVFLITFGRKRCAPAHLFLMSRIALTAAGYLTPFLPIPGYPRWPYVSLGRGAKVSWPPSAKSSGIPRTVIELFAKELMPSNSEVTIDRLESGQSGAEVFRLDVKDEDKIQEVPRVLKVHGEPEIVEELRRYYKFVHNKRVGGTSRIDSAGIRSLQGKSWGAVIYVMVGAGEEAQPWSRWARSASQAWIEIGLQKLYDQLLCWYNTIEPVPKSSIDLLISTPLISGEWMPGLHNASNPSWDNVYKLLDGLSKSQSQTGPRSTRTCVVHGDLHAGNIFSLVSKQSHRKPVVDVAVIDWGNVSGRRHLLSDIAKLMIDLHYKIRWGLGDLTKERNWAFGIVQAWGDRLGEPNWIPPLLHHMAKMLFYVSPDNPQSPYLSKESRVQMWKDMNELTSMLKRHRYRPSKATR